MNTSASGLNSLITWRQAPHGGVKGSGFGKDMSDYSLEEYLTIKHVMSDITGVADKGWHRTIFTKR